MIRVLQVLGGLDLGGAESRVMDLYRRMDRKKIQFDFCIHVRRHCHFEVEIAKLGGRVFRVPSYRVANAGAYRAAWRKLLTDHPELSIIHGHMTSTAGIYLPIAKELGRVTIAHARSAGVDPGIKGFLTKKLRTGLLDKADYCLACSALAGEAVFGEGFKDAKNAQVFPNAVDADAFAFDIGIRNSLRRELMLPPEAIVMGHVGRFHYAKNHEFLLKVFAECLKALPQMRLLLVGDGPLREKIENQAAEAGIAESCLFVGAQTDPMPFYQAMDLFVFPSHYEGLPGSLVEAQVSGLPCLISDRIAKEAVATSLVEQMPLEDGPEAWAARVLGWVSDWGGVVDREDHVAEIRKAGLDCNEQASLLEEFYLSLGKSAP